MALVAAAAVAVAGIGMTEVAVAAGMGMGDDGGGARAAGTPNASPSTAPPDGDGEEANVNEGGEGEQAADVVAWRGDLDAGHVSACSGEWATGAGGDTGDGSAPVARTSVTVRANAVASAARRAR